MGKKQITTIMVITLFAGLSAVTAVNAGKPAPSNLFNIGDSIGEGEATVSSKECSFCHSQSAPPDVVEAINKDGYFIYKMEGC